MTTVISLFNHKGGVSKTTTAFNLGWSLANEGKRVLLVDLDSQCNLTGLLLGYARLDSGLDAFYDSRNNLTLLNVIDPLIDGVPVDSVLENEKNSKLFQTNNPNLSLLPGHLKIADMDSQISIALKIAMGIPATRNLPGALPEFIRKLAEIHGYEYVICDMSPNIGGLNEVMLMSSDYFIVPTAPDFFSWQAVLSLKKYLQSWKKEIESFKISTTPKAAAYLHAHPQFMGTIQQRYRIRNQAPAKSFSKWMDAIRDTVDKELVPALQEFKCIIPKDTVQKVLDSENSDTKAYDLAHISDFNSLIAISQKLSKPVFELTNDDLKDAEQFGWALKTMNESRDSFKAQFKQFARIVLSLTSK